MNNEEKKITEIFKKVYMKDKKALEEVICNHEWRYCEEINNGCRVFYCIHCLKIKKIKM